jgi:hypothetical protein
MVKQAVLEANRRYGGMNDAEIREAISRIDEEWIASKRKSPEVDRVLNTPLSRFFMNYKINNPKVIGEVFVTDRQGATVAMTKPLTDYYQADEQWWTDGLEKGVFVDDRGYDLSIQAIAMGVVVPVKDGEKTIGVLKINFQVSKIGLVTNLRIRCNKPSGAAD